MLRNPCLILALSILMSPFFSYGQHQDGSVLEKRITLVHKNQRLSFILDQLSWQAGVYFSYDSSIIDPEKISSINAIDKSLYFVLSQLFDTKVFGFSELENQVIITKKIPVTNSATPVADTVPVTYFFLTGKITDAKKGSPVEYATISVLNEPIGTISNPDGEFLLKIHPDHIRDTIVISCMGYSRILMPAYMVLDEDIIEMVPVSIRIREIKVTTINPHQLLKNIRENIEKNYSSDIRLITAFYRESVKQDGDYVNISEAVLEILKSPYINTFREDLVKLIKGRRSPEVKRVQWLNFKLQGGPFTITKLDVVKTMESFIDEDYENLYRYSINRVIWYNEHPVYVLEFTPVNDVLAPGFTGELYVHRETFAIVHANFRLTKKGLRDAESMMIRKKPARVSARPSFVNYLVSYQELDNKWYLSNAQASVKFRVRSKHDHVNSEFHSISDLLVTNITSTPLRKFPRSESFTQNDIFVEMIGEYDEKFWENYNIIKPDEDIRNALKKIPEN